MPRTKGAKKALRVSKKKQRHNYALRARLKTSLKKFLSKKEKTQKDLAETISTIDKSAKANIIHKNKAARLKARLAKFAMKPSTVTKTKTKAALKKRPAKKKTK